MKKKEILVIGISLLMLSVVFSGCLTSGADVKITSVNVSKNHPEYTLTIGLKNIGDEGDNVNLRANFYVWSDYWYLTDSEGKTVGYIDKGDTTTTTLIVEHNFGTSDEETKLYKIEILASTASRKKDKMVDTEYASDSCTDMYTEEFHALIGG